MPTLVAYAAKSACGSHQKMNDRIAELALSGNGVSPVFVPSRGRAGNSPTILELLRDGITPNVVVRTAELETYKRAYPQANILPTTWTGIGLTRRFIQQLSRDARLPRIWMLDDDLDDPRTRKHFGAPYEFISWKEWLGSIEDLTDHPMMGAACGMTRQYGWMEDSAIPNKRVGYAVVLRPDGPWDYWPFLHEDTDITLQILTKGYHTVKLPQYVFHTETMNKRQGGCQKDYERGAAERAGRVLVSKWDHYSPGLVRVGKNKEGNTVTRVRWADFRKGELEAPGK